ncbi:MAG: glycosyltransferase family 2 protein [Eubacteriales bacterium]|nr:glycosyltransferase family 2 protein [Eubacteriales bacterium]
MFITVCVIAYNEEKSINRILEDISNQDYAHSDMEVVLVDGASGDRTKCIMEKYAADNNDSPDPFRRVVVLDNPKRTLPSGWNVALKEYKGDAIIKVDAHAQIPKDFVSKNVKVLESGEYICGGVRPTILDESTPWRETLLLAENSMFGSSIAPYRNNPGRSYVKSMFHAAYRREVFDKVGFFNEELVRTEDNEIHYRMRKAGYKLCFDPDIISYQHIRSSLPKMLKQKYSNGYWIGVTSMVCPECLSIYHFVPFAFVTAIAATTVGQAFRKTCKIASITAKLMWGAYASLAVGMSVLSSVKAKDRRNRTNLLLPVLFLLLHLSYGIGTVAGLLKGSQSYGRNKKR